MSDGNLYVNMNNIRASGCWDIMELVDQVTWPPELDRCKVKGIVGQLHRQ